MNAVHRNDRANIKTSQKSAKNQQQRTLAACGRRQQRDSSQHDVRPFGRLVCGDHIFGITSTSTPEAASFWCTHCSVVSLNWFGGALGNP
jgi:hypothetical protein